MHRNSRRYFPALCVALALYAGLHTPSYAAEFTNKDFLEWTKRDRDQWLEGAVLMAGHMVHLHDQRKAQCVFDWYLKNPIPAQGELFASMQKYPQATPTGTMIALLRHRCGKPLIIGAQR